MTPASPLVVSRLQEALDALGIELTRSDCQVAADAARAAVLCEEADWLATAYDNSADKGFSSTFRDGFKCAAGWVRFHARGAA